MPAPTRFSHPSPETAPPRQAHLAFIDALRGIACLGVLLYHATGGRQTDVVLRHTHLGVKTILQAVVGFGWLGVPLFLVLSGFCLFYPVVRRAEGGGVTVDAGSFLARRARRIFPPYYAAIVFALTISWLLHRPTQFAGWYDLPMHLLLIHNLRTDTLPTIDIVFWSLALEWQMYLLFPLFIGWIRRWGVASLAVAAGALSVVWCAIVRAQLGIHLLWWQTAATYDAVPGFAFIFIAGMCAAALVAHPRRPSAVPALTVAVCTAIPALYYAGAVSAVGPFVPLAWGTVFAALIVAGASLPARLFGGKGILPALASVGVYSYSLYLIHHPLLGLMAVVGSHLFPHGVLAYLWYGARLVVILALAYVFFLAFERPFLTKRKAATPAEPSHDAVLSPVP